MKLLSPISQQIRDLFREYRLLGKNTIILWSSRATGVCILAAFIILIAWFRTLPTEVPLWYSKPWGSTRLADPRWLFLLPGASVFWFIMNALVSLRVTKNHLVFSQILFLGSLFVSAFSCITLIMIIWIIS